MSTTGLALLTLLSPAAAAAVLAVAPALRRGRIAAGLSIAAVLVSFGAAVALLSAIAAGAPPVEVAVTWLPGAGVTAPLAELGLRADGISATMLVAVTLVAACVQIFSVAYLHDEPPPALGRYFAYQSLFVVAMGTLVLAPNLLQLFVGWELVGVTSYLLIGHWYRKPTAARAALKAFWLTKLADVGFVFALLVVLDATGTFRWDAPIAAGAATVATLLLVVAVAGKSAQFPLHVWLPDAMEGPTPVSALLHAATMVAAGVYLVVRTFPLFEAAELTGLVLAHAGAFTALFAAGLAIVQTDLKRMLAYSTCSQLGYMLAALGAGSLVGGYFHLLTHAAFKALLFLAAGNVIHAVGTNEMGSMGGLWPRMKVTAIAFGAGALALAGVPGLSGAFSKDLVLEAVAARGLWLPYALLLAAVPATAFYMGRAALRVFGGPARDGSAHEAPPAMLLPVLALAVPAVLAGFLGGPIAELAGGTYAFHVGPTAIAATALSLGGLALAWSSTRGGAAARALAGLLAALDRLARTAIVDRAWAAAFTRIFQPVAAACAYLDRYVVDALVNVAGAGALAAGRRLRPIQTGYVPDYLLAVASAAVVLLLWGLW